MSGTVLGGKSAAKTNKDKYGRDYYARIGAMGGVKGRTGGFASKLVGPDGLTGPERAAIAGARGGSLSIRGKANKLKEDKMSKPIRHGEVLLRPVAKLSGKIKEYKEFIVGHSETGHHHVLVSDKPFEVSETEKHDLYVQLFEPASLVHKKQIDAHKTLKVAPGKYKVIYKTEYNPWDEVITRVFD